MASAKNEKGQLIFPDHKKQPALKKRMWGSSLWTKDDETSTSAKSSFSSLKGSLEKGSGKVKKLLSRKSMG